jgi:hypothetical protein
MYTESQTITMPANCRTIDIILCGAGGLAGEYVLLADYITYGGSGAGGNMQTANGLPLLEGEELDLTLTSSNTETSGSTTLQYKNIIFAQAFDGSNGFDGNATGDFATNETEGQYNSTFGTFFTAFGSDGTFSGITNYPTMNLGQGFPKGASTWVEGDYGMAQRSSESGEKRGLGYCLITYHLG